MSTHTPESVWQMLDVCLLLAGLAPMVAASYLVALVPGRDQRVRPSLAYALVLLLLGVVLSDRPAAFNWLFPASDRCTLLAWLLVPLLGWLAFQMDLRITRLGHRRNRGRHSVAPVTRVDTTLISPWTRTTKAQRPAPDFSRTYSPPGILLLVGAFEEWGFRAVLIWMAAEFVPGPGLAGWALFASVWFAWSHANSDAVQAWAKLPLSAAAGTQLLIAGLLPAMATHVLFNVLALRYLRRHAEGGRQ